MFSRPNFLNFGAKSAAILLMDFIGVARVKAIVIAIITSKN